MYLYRFYEHGHTVVGVELFEKAIKEHLDDNKIDYSVEEVEQIGKIFRVSSLQF